MKVKPPSPAAKAAPVVWLALPFFHGGCIQVGLWGRLGQPYSRCRRGVGLRRVRHAGRLPEGGQRFPVDRQFRRSPGPVIACGYGVLVLGGVPKDGTGRRDVAVGLHLLHHVADGVLFHLALG